MIIHVTRKLADRLSDMSNPALAEHDVLGGWHAGRIILDHRQYVPGCTHVEHGLEAK